MRRFGFISVNNYIRLIAMGAIGLSLVSFGSSAPKMRLANEDTMSTKGVQTSGFEKLKWLQKVEELELKNLKVNEANDQRSVSESSNSELLNNPKRSVTTADSSLKPVPQRPTKLPVNEELPAASDNSNSERVSSESSQGKSEDRKRKKISEKELMVNSENSDTVESTTEPESNVITNNTNNMDISEYTPRDVAEYIFRTGDEKGVVLAIYEFILQDLLSRDYAIQFLEAVKEELNEMKNGNPLAHQVNSDESSSISTKTTSSSSADKESRKSITQGNSQPTSAGERKEEKSGLSKSTSKKRILRNSNVREGERSNYNLNPAMIMGNNNDESSRAVDNNSEYEAVHEIQSENGPGVSFPSLEIQSQSQLIEEKPHEPRKGPRKSYSIEDLDYDELVEKLQVAESKLREYSLEEVIYYLAKELFSQGLHETEEAHEEHSIRKFAQVIQNGAANGYIPKDLEKTILDTLVRALVDAVMEHEHGLTSHRLPLNRINVNTSPKSAQHQIKMR